MTGEDPERREPEAPPDDELAPTGAWDAQGLADRIQDRAGDLFRDLEVLDGRLVHVEGIPELLGDALTALRDAVGMEELLAITVVDRTDLGEGLEVVHHLGRQEAGPLLQLTTPYPQAEEGITLASVPSSARLWRSAEWMEREAWELSGVVFVGHPGLEHLLLPNWWSGHPLRRDGALHATQGLGDAVLTPSEGGPTGEGWRPAELPVASMGGRLDLRVRAQEFRVTGAWVSVGMLHRGIEGLCGGRTFTGALPVVARAAVRSSVHWQVAFAEAVESLCGLEVPARGVAIRVALLELERIADHMLAHATTLDLLGCRTAAARVWADRELVMDAAQAVTGQRLVQDAVVIGGVTCDAEEGWPRRAMLLSRTVQAAVHEYVREGEALHPLARLEGLVPVHVEDVHGWGLSGPVLRASGVVRDARADGRSHAYGDLEVPVVTRKTCDAMGRTEVRLLEMAASAKVLSNVVRGMPGGRVRAHPPEVFPKGTAVGVVEDPRGELMCYVSSDGTERPRRVRFRSPDLAHAAALGELLIDCPEDDVALAVASIDVHVGGIDR